VADVQSNIQVNLDASQALAQLKALQRQLATFHSSVATTSTAAAKAQASLQSNLINSVNATGKFAAGLTTIKSSADSFTDSLERNKFSTREYFRYAGGATKTFGRIFKTEFDTIGKVAEERVKAMQTQYIKMGRDANGAIKAIAVRPLALDMDNLATKTALAAQKQQLFNQLMKQGSTNLLNFGKNTQWAGRQLMVGFTVPLTMLGMTAGKTFMALEKQAIRFKRVYGEMFTTSGETEKAFREVEALAKSFTKYGVAVEKTMEMAADAAASGKAGAELMAQVAQATRLAVLGSVEQEKALETTISLTNAFGIEADKLKEKIDFLNAVENQTVLNIEDLTIAVPKAGPVIRQLGGDVEDLAFFMTAMKEGGINASEGANALKSGLASLINPSKKAAGFLKDLGVDINGIVEGNQGNVKNTVVEFAQALDTLDPLNRSRAIEQLFGKFQFSRLSTLFQNVTKDGTQASRTLGLAQNSVQELAILSERELAKVEEATGTKFKKSLEDLKVSLAPVGEQFLKALTPVVEFIGKILEKFNGLSDGAKARITKFIAIVGLIGPAVLMTFGLVANGVANLLKLFITLRKGFFGLGGQSKILGQQIQYMSSEQIEAATVAASLDQAHSKLRQTFLLEAASVNALTTAYQKGMVAANSFARTNPGMMKPGLRPGVPKKFADGGWVPGTGNKDTVPAVLTPGEFVVTKDAAQENKGFLQRLNKGGFVLRGDGTEKNPYAGEVKGGTRYDPTLPKFRVGSIEYAKALVAKQKAQAEKKKLFLGMPNNFKQVQDVRQQDAVLDEINNEVKNSNLNKVKPTNFGKMVAESSGRSFPVPGIGGIYERPDGSKVFVKPFLDEKSAVAEMRGTKIARDVHGLVSPDQKLSTMIDPNNPNRKLIVLQSAFDPRFADMTGEFTKSDFVKQAVASVIRGDKDLSKSNVSGNRLPDVGTAGVFATASAKTPGQRQFGGMLPVKDQAMVNFLGVNGGAKRYFADATRSIAQSMTPAQYERSMIEELNRVLPKLKSTIAGFGNLTPDEKVAYAEMVQRVEDAKKINWKEIHKVHTEAKVPTIKKPKIKASEKTGERGHRVSIKDPAFRKILVAGGFKLRGETQTGNKNISVQDKLQSLLLSEKEEKIPVTENQTEKLHLTSGKNSVFHAPGTNKAGHKIDSGFTTIGNHGYNSLSENSKYKNLPSPYPFSIKEAQDAVEMIEKQLKVDTEKGYENLKPPSPPPSKKEKEAFSRETRQARLALADLKHNLKEFDTAQKWQNEQRHRYATAGAMSDGKIGSDAYKATYERLGKLWDSAVTKGGSTAQITQALVDDNKEYYNRLTLTQKNEVDSNTSDRRSTGGKLSDATTHIRALPNKSKIIMSQQLKNLVDNPEEMKKLLAKSQRDTKSIKDIKEKNKAIQEKQVARQTIKTLFDEAQNLNDGNKPIFSKNKRGTAIVPAYNTDSGTPRTKQEGGGIKAFTKNMRGVQSQSMLKYMRFKLMASGGSVPGYGEKDTVPALLTPGEFVVNKAATQEHGPILEAMNSGNVEYREDGTTLTGSEIKQQRKIKTQAEITRRAKMAERKIQADAIREERKLIVEREQILKQTLETTKADADSQSKAQEKDRKLQAKNRVSQTTQKVSGGLMMGGMALGMLGAAAPEGSGMQKVASAVAPLAMVGSMLIPMLGTPAGAAAAAILILAGGLVKLRMDFDKANDAALKLGESTGASTKVIQGFAEFANTITGTESMDKTRAVAKGKINTAPGKTTFGEAYIQTEGGKELIKSFADIAKSSSMKNVVNKLRTQLSTAVLSGALNADQARSIALNIGEELGNQQIGLQVSGQLLNLFGKNGSNVLKDGIELQVSLMADASKTNTKLVDSLNQKGRSGSGLKSSTIMSGFGALGAGLGVAGAAALGAKMGGTIGTAVGGPLGMGIGLAAGAAIGVGLTYWAQKNKNKQIGNLAGAAVANTKAMMEQSRQLRDQYEREYLKRKEQLELEGKFGKVRELELKYLDDRKRFDSGQVAQREQFMKDYASTKGNSNARGAMDTSLDKSMTDAYKKDPIGLAMVGTAKDSLNQALRNKTMTREQVALAKASVGSKELDPSALVGVFQTFKDQKDIQANMTILTQLGGDELSASQNIVSAFIDKNGKPIPKLQSEFVAKLSGLKGKEADDFITTFQGITAMSGLGINIDVEADYVMKNKNVRDSLYEDITAIEKTKGKITSKMLTVIDSEFTGVLAENPKFLDTLSASDKITYSKVIRQFISIPDIELQAEGDFLLWQAENKTKLEGVSIGRQLDMYRQSMGEKAVTASTPLFSDPATPKKSGGGTRSTIFDDTLKKLKQVQRSSVNAMGGRPELIKQILGKNAIGYGDGEGIDQKLLKDNKVSSEFLNFVDSLGPEGIQKDLGKIVTIGQKGIATLTQAGQALQKAFGLIKFGEKIKDMQLQKQELKNRIVAMRVLLKLGFDNATATSLAADSATALAIATGQISVKDLKNYKKDMKELTDLQTDAARIQDIAQKTGIEGDIARAEALKKIVEAQEALIEGQYLLERTALNAQKSENDYGLDLIARQEDKVNEIYDEQIKALQEVNSLAEKNNALTSEKMSIADALASGDMAAASNAMQAYRTAKIQQVAKTREEALQKSKENAIKSITVTNSKTGKISTREDLEKLNKDIDGKLADIDEKIRLQKEQLSVELKAASGMTKAEVTAFAATGQLLIDAYGVEAANKMAKGLYKTLKGDGDAFNTTIAQGTTNLETFIAKLQAARKEAGLSNFTGAVPNGPGYLGVPGLNADGTFDPKTAASPDFGPTITPPSKAPAGSPAGSGTSKSSTPATAAPVVKVGTTPTFVSPNAADNAAKKAAAAKKVVAKLPTWLKFASGGIVPKYMASGGLARRTDTVPAMLTPGEYVINKDATQKFGPLLSAINSPTFKTPTSSNPNFSGINSSSNITSTNNSKTLYNYNLSVNVSNSNANPNDIARTVINQIKMIENQRIRGY
jgi:TP901 family phage tail tape measure protein